METKQDSTTNIEASEIQCLDPGTLRFFRHGATLRLTVRDEVSYPKVTVLRVFPLSEPHRYLSVRYGDNKEVGLIVDPKELDGENRQLVEAELDRRYLVPTIQRVIGVKERFGTLEWKVETDRGLWSFTTRNLRENVAQPGDFRYLITDVDGNRFDVPDLTALDSTSQGWLLKYL